MFREKKAKLTGAAVIGLSLLFMLSCASKKEYSGQYEAKGEGRLKDSEIVLDLKDDGEGRMRVDDDEVTFRWNVKRGQLRLNTKEGGVIVGEIKGDTFIISLPGWKDISFKRKGS